MTALYRFESHIVPKRLRKWCVALLGLRLTCMLMAVQSLLCYPLLMAVLCVPNCPLEGSQNCVWFGLTAFFKVSRTCVPDGGNKCNYKEYSCWGHDQ